MRLSKEFLEKAGFTSVTQEGFDFEYQGSRFEVEYGYKTEDGVIVELCDYSRTFQLCRSMEEYRKTVLEFLFDDSASSRAQKKYPTVQLLKSCNADDAVSIHFVIKNPTEKNVQDLALALREVVDIEGRKKTFVRKTRTLLKKWVYQE